MVVGHRVVSFLPPPPLVCQRSHVVKHRCERFGRRLVVSSSATSASVNACDSSSSPTEQHKMVGSSTSALHSSESNTLDSAVTNAKIQSLWYRATISSIRQLTPSVTGWTLLVDKIPYQQEGTGHDEKDKQNKITHGKYGECDGENEPLSSSSSSTTTLSFAFLPGQWVDYYIPQIDTVGGYSITSIPSQLPTVELAVKKSLHPPAAYVAEKAKVGDWVKVRVGGDFVYCNPKNQYDDCSLAGNKTLMSSEISAVTENERGSSCTITAPTRCSSTREKAATTTRRVLFIAGGVGINPLYSMLRQMRKDEFCMTMGSARTFETEKQYMDGKQCILSSMLSLKAVLLYSASSKEELLFEREITAIMNEFPNHFRVIYTVTGDDGREKSRPRKENLKISNGDEKSLLATGSQVNEEGESRDISVRVGRVSPEMINDAMTWLRDEEMTRANEDDDMYIKNCSSDGSKMIFEASQIRQDSDDIAVDAVYMCGPPGMAEAMSEIFIAQYGLSKSIIHYEQWW